MGRPDLSVCVAAWKPRPEPNVKTLWAELPGAAAGLSYELVVALNGLSPSAAAVPPDATIIDLGRNRGIPVAWNRAAARARAPVLCFVNDDVGLGQGALRLLWEALRGGLPAGVAGPEGTRFDFASRRHLELVRTDDLDAGELRECDTVTGFLFATPRAVLEQAGGFDEAYTPCWFEDVDYCTTVRQELGLCCYVVGGLHFRHEAGISAARPWRRIHYDGHSETAFAIGRRNSRYFRTKWGTAAAGSR